MMEKYDFKAALETMPDDWPTFDETMFIEWVLGEHRKAIQTALRIAHRLQSGEVSEEVRRVIENLMMVCGCDEPIPELEDRFFKAMAAQMIKEEGG